MLKVFAFVAGAALAKVETEQAGQYTESEYWTMWKKFIGLFDEGMGRYSSMAEHDKRFGIFKSNMDIAAEHNAGDHGWTMGITQFADMTSFEFEEFLERNSANKIQFEGERTTFDASQYPTAPDAKDWVDEGAVTPVKDQGQCGSCWAFSTTGSLESANKLHGDGVLASLSEQMLVDCSGSAGNQGCNGGLMDNAFKWIKSNGICLESAYPYTGKDGSCEKSRCSPSIKTIQSWTDVKDEDDLTTAVGNVGPVSIAVDANIKWQLYSGGVMSASFCPKGSLDHGVLAVGYKKGSYWKIKNSWNTSWGESGYMRIVYGSNACGLANQPSYPVLN